MPATDSIQVWADLTCPFTHVGLHRVVQHVDRLPVPVDVIVRAWPLEWVNGEPLAADAVLHKAEVLRAQLGVDEFVGLRADRWPSTTVPALGLAAAAYGRDAVTGRAVSLELRRLLFEEGLDVADPEVLAGVAARHGVELPDAGAAEAAVLAEYEEGRRRGVVGSPHFFHGSSETFCPTLDIGHDSSGGLTARFDPGELARFLARVHPAEEG